MQKRLAIPLAVLAILAIFFAGYGYAVLTTTKQIQSGANVVTDVNLSVYDSESASVELTFVDWQTILPTQVKTKTIWVQNDANIAMMISVYTKDWLPTYANESMTFTSVEGAGWSGGAYPKLNPQQRASMILTLSAGSNPPSGAFTFTIVVQGVAG
jgi:hypothetical protein